ncbi:MAG: DNA recombination protein RmuC [Dehalococcoidia bacterium]|nr:DNA recombination protein RmuC [Dehalococcoidia bacterium]
MEYLIGGVIGLIAGMIVGGVFVLLIARASRDDIKNSFSALSQDALNKNSEAFLILANEKLSGQQQAGVKELDGKKELIDQTLKAIRENIQKVEKSISDFDGKRERSFGELNAKLKSTEEQTNSLRETTGRLHSILSNTKSRGQWGERMAEDVLRLAGFVDGINYLKQQTQEVVASRPDYTFLLPQGMKLNMDVKFPFDNYAHFVTEENEAAREQHKRQFLKDVRQRLKEVTTRDYINPQEKTLDYVLVFVPNEQVYSFINENDHAIIDDALKSKIVICSPLTLYAILAVIRQAIENFNLGQTTSRISQLLGDFGKQWQNFKTSMDRMGKKIKESSDEFDTLSTTRTNQLERVLIKIDELRKQQLAVDDPVIVLQSELDDNEDKGDTIAESTG